MELAASGGAAGEEGFEELDGSGDDDGGVPVLGGLLGADLVWGLGILGFAVVGFLVLTLSLDGGVVFEDDGGAVVKGAENVSVDAGVLLDDREERQDDDDAAEAVFFGVNGRVPEREGHHGERLARAGGSGEAETAGGKFGLREAGFVEGSSRFVDGGWSAFGLEMADVGVEPLEQFLSLEGAGRTLKTGHVALGVEVVGIDEAGKEHTDYQFLIEGGLQAAPGVSQELGNGIRQDGSRGFRLTVVVELADQGFGDVQGVERGILELRVQVGPIVKPGVMAQNGQPDGGGQSGFQRSGSAEDGVLGFGASGAAAEEVVLEFGAVLAEVVEPAGPGGEVGEWLVVGAGVGGEVSGT